MEQPVLEYIKMRMGEMSFANYTYAAIRIQGINKVDINAQNEYYYLISKTIPGNCVIISETNLFNEAADYGNFNFYQVQEFSGAMQIVQAGNIDLEFIRVIPRIESTPEVNTLILAQQRLIAELYKLSHTKK